MPLFFFDTTAAGDLVRDDTGLQVEGHEDVKRHADAAVYSLASQARLEGSTEEHFACTVRDEHGVAVYSAGLLFMGRWEGAN